MKRLILAAMTVAALTVGSKAEAALTYSITLCQGLTCSTFPTNILTNQVIGDYNITLLTAGGLSLTNTAISATNTFFVSRTTNTSTDPLSVWFTASGYTSPTGAAYNFDVTMSTDQSTTDLNSARGLVTYQAWYSSTNGTVGLPPAGSQPSNLASCTPVDTGGVDSCANNPADVIVSPGSSLFSITSLTQIFIGLGDTSLYQTTASANLTAIPEPGSMVLLGSGLLGMAAMLRRRYARS